MCHPLPQVHPATVASADQSTYSTGTALSWRKRQTDRCIVQSRVETVWRSYCMKCCYSQPMWNANYMYISTIDQAPGAYIYICTDDGVAEVSTRLSALQKLVVVSDSSTIKQNHRRRALFKIRYLWYLIVSRRVLPSCCVPLLIRAMKREQTTNRNSEKRRYNLKLNLDKPFGLYRTNWICSSKGYIVEIGGSCSG